MVVWWNWVRLTEWSQIRKNSTVCWDLATWTLARRHNQEEEEEEEAEEEEEGKRRGRRRRNPSREGEGKETLELPQLPHGRSWALEVVGSWGLLSSSCWKSLKSTSFILNIVPVVWCMGLVVCSQRAASQWSWWAPLVYWTLGPNWRKYQVFYLHQVTLI